MSDKFNESLKRISDLEDLLKKLTEKVNDHIEHDISYKEKNNEKIEKIKEIAEKQKLKLEELDTKCVDLDNRKLDKDAFKVLENDFNLIKIKMKRMEDSYIDFKQRIETIEKQLKEILKKLESLNSGSTKRKSTEKVNIKTNIDEGSLNEKIEDLRNELLELIKELEGKIDNKASMNDLWKSEETLLEKLDEVVGALLKKNADKNETKKALLILEKSINKLYANFYGNRDPNDEGLVVKRPLFWGCLSCGKDLDNFKGKLGDYKNWAVFPPKETSPSRMGRFGLGYAKMMENRKNNIEKEREKDMFAKNVAVNSAGKTSESGEFPNINKEDAKKKN